MAKAPITWKTVTASNNTGALNLFDRSFRNLGNSISGLGDVVTDYSDFRVEQDTDNMQNIIRDLASDEARSQAIAGADPSFLDMGILADERDKLIQADFRKAAEEEKVLERAEAEKRRAHRAAQRPTELASAAIGFQTDLSNYRVATQTEGERIENVENQAALLGQQVAEGKRKQNKTQEADVLDAEIKTKLAEVNKFRGTPEFVAKASALYEEYRDNVDVPAEHKAAIATFRKDALAEIPVDIGNTFLGQVLGATSDRNTLISQLGQRDLNDFATQVKEQVEAQVGPVTPAELKAIIAREAKNANIDTSLKAIKTKLDLAVDTAAKVQVERQTQALASIVSQTGVIKEKADFVAAFGQAGNGDVGKGHAAIVEQLLESTNSNLGKRGNNIVSDGTISHGQFSKDYDFITSAIRDFSSKALSEGEIAWIASKFIRQNTQIDGEVFTNKLEYTGKGDHHHTNIDKLKGNELFDLVASKFTGALGKKEEKKDPGKVVIDNLKAQGIMF